MDSKDRSIIAQTCVKAACDLLSGIPEGINGGTVLDYAAMFEAWVLDAEKRSNGGNPHIPATPAEVPHPAQAPAPLAQGISSWTCPVCQSEMKQRSGKFGDFLGCVQYPTCKGTRQLDGRARQ